MAPSFKDSAAAAVRALQQWYQADSFAKSTGLYHYDDQTFSATDKFFLNLGGYLNAAGDMRRWWNSANAITALIDYISITKDYTYIDAVYETFANAQNGYTVSISVTTAAAVTTGIAGAAVGAALGPVVLGPVGAILGPALGFLGGGAAGAAVAAATFARTYYTNFLNSFYDDEGWWALALIRGYDLTKVEKYLEQAVYIFNDMASGWDRACNGGIYWGKDHKDPSGKYSPYKNAIANELFMAVGAALYLRFKAFNPGEPVPDSVQAYLTWAIDEWQWFYSSGLINGKHLINDSLTTSQSEMPCINDGTQAVWTYNQGVILGALCDLAESTGNRTYLGWAEKIADAFIQNPVFVSSQASTASESGINNGILAEFTDLGPDQSIDHVQFKGIFVRNLAYLFTKTHNPRYRACLMKNATSALQYMNGSNEFGRRWDAPVDTADFIRQTAALDLLNAAMVVQSVAADLSYLEPLLLNDQHDPTDMSYLDPLLLNHH